MPERIAEGGSPTVAGRFGAAVQFRVHLGEDNITRPRNGNVLSVRNVLRYPDFHIGFLAKGDVALLELSGTLCVPRSNARSARRIYLSSGQVCWSTCWSMRCWIAALSPLSPRVTASTNPQALRRTDGSSVYTVAGSVHYTSQRILDAERRLLTAAGRRDGSAVDESAVDLALLEMAANTTALDAGQASLVRQMCTSGARLQLAIAPAGARKTTAMRALALAWTQDGGQVLGFAASGRSRRPRRANRHPH
jgi:hypothetical protein